MPAASSRSAQNPAPDLRLPPGSVDASLLPLPYLACLNFNTHSRPRKEWRCSEGYAESASSMGLRRWRPSMTSHVHASPVTAPRLHDADHQAVPCWSEMGSPSSRARSFFTCQVLRLRRADRMLVITHLIVLPSASATAWAPGLFPYAAQRLAP